MTDDPLAFADSLERLAAPVLEGTPLLELGASAEESKSFIENFRDNAGHRRLVDRPMLSAMLGVRIEIKPDESPEVSLWSALAAGDRSLIRNDITESVGPIGEPFDGAIETWTESQLASLHALNRCALRFAEPALVERSRTLASWLLENIQPDNATNHPWASHVFFTRGDEEGRMYASTLVHNSIVIQGKPDTFSACILLDSARAIRRT